MARGEAAPRYGAKRASLEPLAAVSGMGAVNRS